MTTALPAEIRSPEGQTLYLNPYRGTYTTSRSYALRMQRNYSRGISQTEARGHLSPTGLSEYQIRAQRFQNTYGFSYQLWRRWERRYVKEINKTRASVYIPGQRGNPITPSDLAQDVEVNRSRMGMGPVPGIVIPPENYTEERLAELLFDIQQYRAGNPLPGRQSFVNRENIRPIELWWYH